MNKRVACTAPEHHVHDAAGFIRAVERACEERGLRLTPIRSRVLALIATAGQPIKAYDLLDKVREEEGAGYAAPPTVYRALDFLLANGFIHKLESVNSFVACHHPNADRHSAPFLICNNCHKAVELEEEMVVATLDAQARVLGFSPQTQTLEVHGLCAACADNSASARKTGARGAGKTGARASR